MTYQLPVDLENRVQELVNSGAYASVDEVLREALSALDELTTFDDPLVVAGISRGLQEMSQGLGSSWEEFNKEFLAARSKSPIE